MQNVLSDNTDAIVERRDHSPARDRRQMKVATSALLPASPDNDSGRQSCSADFTNHEFSTSEYYDRWIPSQIDNVPLQNMSFPGILCRYYRPLGIFCNYLQRSNLQHQHNA